MEGTSDTSLKEGHDIVRIEGCQGRLGTIKRGRFRQLRSACAPWSGNGPCTHVVSPVPVLFQGNFRQHFSQYGQACVLRSFPVDLDSVCASSWLPLRQQDRGSGVREKIRLSAVMVIWPRENALSSREVKKLRRPTTASHLGNWNRETARNSTDIQYRRPSSVFPAFAIVRM
jgi:hypothetical protein